MVRIYPPSATDLDPRPIFEVVTARSVDTIWIDLRGELDISGHRQLGELLGSLDLRGVRTVHLQMSRLEFCDSRGLRVLDDFATRVRRRGGDVRVHGAGVRITKVARLLGVDCCLPRP